MSGSKSSAPSKTTQQSLRSDEVVELAPPKDSGFSGTARFLASDHVLIDELIRRGYTRVERQDDAA